MQLRYMVNEAILSASGRNAMGLSQSQNHFEIGKSFDAVVYNAHKSHLLDETTERNRLATLLYTADSSRSAGHDRQWKMGSEGSTPHSMGRSN
jgi:formimidoylglutamate deiminase